MDLKLGKKPARPGAVQLRFGAYFNAAALPTPPMVIGQPQLIRSWGMLANDKYGCCVWSGGEHETMLLEAEAGSPVAPFTPRTCLTDYAACTGFDPNDPNTDQGTDVQTAAAYRQKTGLLDGMGNRHKIDIYAGIGAGNLTQLALAVELFGVAGVGVQLPSDAEDQFNYGEVWDVGTHVTIVGGHYIPCVGRNSHGNFLFVSWGKLQAATPRWVVTYMDEGIAFISRERLNSKGLTPQGYNAAALEDDFKQVTS